MKQVKTTGTVNLARILLGAAAMIAGVLSWSSLAGSPLAGCGDGVACDSLLKGRWGSVMGIPVAVIGLNIYLLALVLSVTGGSKFMRLAVWVSIPAAAAWFFGLQMSEGTFCPWCCAAHALGSIGAAFLLLDAWRGQQSKGVKHAISGICAGVAAVGVMVAIQAYDGGRLSLAPAVTAAEKGENVMTFQLAGENEVLASVSDSVTSIRLGDGKFVFDAAELPRIGSSDAKHLIVALTDYTCPHCCSLYSVLEEAQKALGDDYAVVKLPATRGAESKDIHGYMLALWKADKEIYARVDARIRAGAVHARSKDVLADVVRSLGGTRFSVAYGEQRQWIDEQIQRTRQVQDAHAEKTGSSILPQVVMGDELILGAHSDAGYYAVMATKFLGGMDALTVPPTSSSPGGRAGIMLTSSVVNAGAVAPGARVPVTAEFVNHDERPMQLGWFNLDMDLAMGEFTREEIMEGGKGSITVMLEVPEDIKDGMIERTITAYPKDDGEPFTFRIQARVADVARVVPADDL